MAITVTDFKGLVTAPGQLVRAPGVCTTAENVTCDAPGVIRKRVGFGPKLPGGTGGPVYQVISSRLLNDKLLVHYGTASTANALRYGTGTGALSAVSLPSGVTIVRDPKSQRTKCAVAQRNHYLTGDAGVVRMLSDYTAAFAGMPEGQAPDTYGMNAAVYSVLTGTGGFLADGASCAYRVTWHRLDGEGVEIGGAPTGRLVVRNITGTSGYAAATAKNTILRVPLPQELGTASTDFAADVYFCRLWRTRTAAANFETDDECYLVFEGYADSTAVTNGYLVATDSTPDSVLIGGPRLHTNAVNFPPGEEAAIQGVLNASEPPPTANDVAYWQDCMWFAETSRRPLVQLTSQALAADGNTFKLYLTTGGGALETYTCLNAPAAATDFQRVSTLGTLSLNLEATLRNMCEVVNRQSTRVYAYYVSAGVQTPGVVRIVSRTTTAYFAECGWAGLPNQPGAGNAAADLTDSAQPNGLYFSKPLQADAVPPQNLLTVGPNDSRVLRIVPYRDRLFVFTDAGIFQVTGQTFRDFNVSPFDTTYRLRQRDLVAVCDDKVYAWCWEGIIELGDGGVRVISSPIEPTFMSTMALLAEVDELSPTTQGVPLGYAVAYRAKHRVMFFFPYIDVNNGEIRIWQWLTWDTRAESWTTGKFADTPGTAPATQGQEPTSCGAVRFSDDRLVYGTWNSASGDAYLVPERMQTNAGTSDWIDEGVVVDASTVATVAFNFWVNGLNELAHWQQTVLQFDGGEWSWRTGYTNQQTVTWTADNGQTASQTTAHPSALAVSRNMARLECPTNVRRSNQLQVQVVDSSTSYFGLTGVSQSFGEASRFVRGKNG